VNLFLRPLTPSTDVISLSHHSTLPLVHFSLKTFNTNSPRAPRFFDAHQIQCLLAICRFPGTQDASAGLPRLASLQFRPRCGSTTKVVGPREVVGGSSESIPRVTSEVQTTTLVLAVSTRHGQPQPWLRAAGRCATQRFARPRMIRRNPQYQPGNTEQHVPPKHYPGG
jgi:hypothetical protein